MDKLKAKKNLYAGLGDFARKHRGQQMRKKYGTGSPELDAIAASQDEAAADVQMPVVQGGNSKLGTEADFESSLEDMAEDEEMQKWMAKQRG